MHRALTACAVVALVALTACNKPSTDASPAGSSSAPLTGDSAGGHERGRPGPGGNEMFEACTGKTAGTACTVKMHDKDMTGTCEAGPGGDASKLACRPAGAPPH